MVKETLDERINDILEHLEGLDPSSEEYKTASTSLENLYKMRIEEEKLEIDKERMYEDISLETKKMLNDRKRNNVELVKVLVPTGAGLLGVFKITAAEEVGSVTSKALNLVTSFFRFRQDDI